MPATSTRPVDGAASINPPPDAYGVAALYYDLSIAHRLESITTPQVDFFASQATCDDRVLEIGAGTGNTTLRIAQRAAAVWCIEPSRAMRAILLTKVVASNYGDRVTVLPGEHVPSGIPPFNYVVLAGVLGSVGHAERATLFQRIAKHLKIGGRLAVDMVDDTQFSVGAPTIIARAAVGDLAYVASAEVRHVHPTAGGQRADVAFVYESSLDGTLIDSEEQIRHIHSSSRDVILQQLLDAGFEQVPPAGRTSGDVAPPRDAVVVRLSGRPDHEDD